MSFGSPEQQSNKNQGNSEHSLLAQVDQATSKKCASDEGVRRPSRRVKAPKNDGGCHVQEESGSSPWAAFGINFDLLGLFSSSQHGSHPRATATARDSNQTETPEITEAAGTKKPDVAASSEQPREEQPDHEDPQPEPWQPLSWLRALSPF